MRILVGHTNRIPEIVAEQALPGRENSGDEIIAFGQYYPEAPFDWRWNWTELLANLCPPDWKPDLYIHWSLEYNAIPEGMREAGCVTAGVLGDWNLGARAMHAGAERFDLLFADRKGSEVLRRAGYDNVHYGLLWSYDPALHRRLPDTDRDIDILMLGNFNHAVQWERARWLARVAKLSDRYQVVLNDNVRGDDYTRLMNRAKIVFNRSVGGGINMRAYETLACGALLFQERENLEIETLFRNGEACVLYGDDDLETLLAHYLAPENTAERERIAETGCRLVQSHSHTHHFGQFLSQIETLISGSQNSGFRASGSQEVCSQDADSPVPKETASSVETTDIPTQIRLMEQWLLTFQPDLLASIEAGIGELAQNPALTSMQAAELANLHAALLGEWARRSPSPHREATLNDAIKQVYRALEREPDFITARCNLAYLYMTMPNPNAARTAMENTLGLLENTNLTARQLRGFFYPRGFLAFDVALERLTGEYVLGTDLWRDALRDLLKGRLYAALAEMAFQRQDTTQAILLSEQAVRYIPEQSWPYYGLATARRKMNRIEPALEAYRQAIALSPFFLEAWHDLVRLLLDQRRPDEALTLMNELSQMLNGCPFYDSLRPTLIALREEVETAARRQATIDQRRTLVKPLRLLAFPDWNTPEHWQPLLRAYIQRYAPADSVSLLLGLGQGRPLAAEQVAIAIERFLTEDLQTDPEAIPDVVLLTEPLEALPLSERLALADALIPVGNTIPPAFAAMRRLSLEEMTGIREYER